jgi:hypothetical protein
MIKEFWSRLKKPWGLAKNIPSGTTALDENFRFAAEGSVVPLRGSSGRQSQAVRKKDNSELFSEAVTKLVDRLEQINASLSLQIQQNQRFVDRIDELPSMLKVLPEQADAQKKLAEELSSALKEQALRDEKLLQAVSAVGQNTSQQTLSLGKINETLGAASVGQARLENTFERFGETLDKLDVDTSVQTEWIGQMSRSFTAMDRYMKYMLDRQNSRLMWQFIILVGVALSAVIALVLSIVLTAGR